PGALRPSHSFPTRRSSDLPQYFAHGNASAARKCMQPVADKLGITVEELATQILDKDFVKVNACINALAEKYQLDHDAMKLVGCIDRKSTRLNSSHVSISYA